MTLPLLAPALLTIDGVTRTFGALSALGDAVALDSAIVLVPGPASTIDLDRLRAAADRSATTPTAPGWTITSRCEVVPPGIATMSRRTPTTRPEKTVSDSRTS